MDIMENMGIKEDRIPPKSYWLNQLKPRGNYLEQWPEGHLRNGKNKNLFPERVTATPALLEPPNDPQNAPFFKKA
ncbi:hypothetical protein NQ317_005338 [Molorchus minor]|uniref:Uncharacterized protein n=1 Tax=Molorchus minor TaxID=1323400 RepID=A0ABQ9JFL4_9CUCU|nr:hypothetical protein NQ317_005338 [Molorchus minor]